MLPATDDERSDPVHVRMLSVLEDFMSAAKDWTKNGNGDAVIRTWKRDGVKRIVPLGYACQVVARKLHISAEKVRAMLLSGHRVETDCSIYQVRGD